MQKRYEETIKARSELLKYLPKDASSLMIRGEAYLMINKKKEGMEDLKNALIYINEEIEVEPTNSGLYFTKSLIYRTLKKSREELEQLNLAIAHSVKFKDKMYYEKEKEKALLRIEIMKSQSGKGHK